MSFTNNTSSPFVNIPNLGLSTSGFAIMYANAIGNADRVEIVVLLHSKTITQIS